MDSQREKELMRGLTEQLESLDVHTETAAGPELTPRCVGVAFAFFKPQVQVETETGDVSDQSPSELEQEIRSHLEAWDSMAPEQFAREWKRYATDPYVGVGPHWVGLVDDDTVKQWMASDDLNEALRTHPPHAPRKVRLSNLQITHLSPARVLATYRVEEEYTNGNMTAGNTFAVLFRTTDGWKIGVASKGTRHEAPIRP